MTVTQLADRMSEWLKGEYQTYLFELESETIGYALYRLEPEYVYLRQLFVQPEMRRQGIARRALNWLGRNAWHVRARVRIDVLVGNQTGIEFWRSVCFMDYCFTMERPVSWASNGEIHLSRRCNWNFWHQAAANAGSDGYPSR